MRILSTASNILKRVITSPWTYYYMLFMMIVLTVKAMDLDDLLKNITPDKIEDVLSDLSVDQICSELLNYEGMCQLFSLNNVVVEGDMNILTPGCTESLGTTSNSAEFFCEAAKLVRKALSPNVIEYCESLNK